MNRRPDGQHRPTTDVIRASGRHPMRPAHQTSSERWPSRRLTRSVHDRPAAATRRLVARRVLVELALEGLDLRGWRGWRRWRGWRDLRGWRRWRGWRGEPRVRSVPRRARPAQRSPYASVGSVIQRVGSDFRQIVSKLLARDAYDRDSGDPHGLCPLGVAYGDTLTRLVLGARRGTGRGQAGVASVAGSSDLSRPAGTLIRFGLVNALPPPSSPSARRSIRAYSAS